MTKYNYFEAVCDDVRDYITEKGAEACDVTIRCYLLPQAIAAVLDEFCEE